MEYVYIVLRNSREDLPAIVKVFSTENAANEWIEKYGVDAFIYTVEMHRIINR